MIKLMGIYWAQPYFFWFLLVVAGAASVLVYRMFLTRKAVAILAGQWQHIVIKHFSLFRQISKFLLLVMSLLFLVFALARPQWQKKDEIVAQEGRDLFIALDISRSMLATDLSPNRLMVAKEKIKQLLKLFDCERVGLILFSGSAFVQCPLTSDYTAFYMYLDHVDVETISSGSTALEAAVKQVLQVYETMPSKKTKLLVVFTDGEDFSSNLQKYKQQAKDAHLKIFTVGVGTVEGAPIPLFDERGNKTGHQKDKRGNVVISHLNDEVLQALSQEAGGSYVSLTHTNDDMKQIVSLIKRYEKEKFEDKKISQFNDKYNYFLLISFICLGLEWLL